MTVAAAQVRVHNNNLWLGRDGQPRGGRSDATIVDAPATIHAPKLILWAAAEAFKAAAIVLVNQQCASVSAVLNPPVAEPQ